MRPGSQIIGLRAIFSIVVHLLMDENRQPNRVKFDNIHCRLPLSLAMPLMEYQQLSESRFFEFGSLCSFSLAISVLCVTEFGNFRI